MKAFRAFLTVAACCGLLALTGCSGCYNNWSSSCNVYYPPGGPAAADGAGPNGLIEGTDGNFYGTTATGGQNGLGTFFRVTPTGVETILYSFVGGTGDGADPEGVVQASDGNFYGATNFGGSGSCQGGCGVVFRITPAGAETVLYFFSGGADGADPNGVIQASDGNLYGTAAYGGVVGTACGGSGCGVAFRMTLVGAETVLYPFKGGTDGMTPVGLIQGSDGSFYGTTIYGGALSNGTVFNITSTGVETVLHSFAGGSDGALPQQTQLVEGPDGKFYGTTPFGGASSLGVVYRVTSAGLESVLHSFAGGATDGAVPNTGVISASDGNFYGTTNFGGSASCLNGCGTVFRLTPAPTESLLFQFPGSSAWGSLPPKPSSLIEAKSGTFYGTTTTGGQFGLGTVFSLTPAGVATLLYSFGTNP